MILEMKNTTWKACNVKGMADKNAILLLLSSYEGYSITGRHTEVVPVKSKVVFKFEVFGVLIFLHKSISQP